MSVYFSNSTSPDKQPEDEQKLTIPDEHLFFQLVTTVAAYYMLIQDLNYLCNFIPDIFGWRNNATNSTVVS